VKKTQEQIYVVYSSAGVEALFVVGLTQGIAEENGVNPKTVLL